MAKKLFKDCKQGDTVYYIDHKKIEIQSLKVKKVENLYDGYSFHFTDKNVKNIRCCIGNRGRNNCLFTMVEDANKLLKKINNGETFFGVKKGSTIYIVKDCDNEIYKISIDKVTKSGYDVDFYYELEGSKHSFCLYYDEMFVNCVSYELYVGKSVEHPSGYLKVIFFISEDIAKKYIEKQAKKREKKAIEKYVNEMQNHDGKPISHQDNLGHDLHYGDTVAYIRRIGYNSHLEIRVGKIIGESKTKITVLDEDEKNSGKPTGCLRRGEMEKTDGKHSVEKQNILLLKLAEVNTNSGFIISK